MLHQNINGIRNKMDTVRFLLEKKDIHIFGFTESHINASVTDNEISVDGYRIERLDRNSGSHGGVVCFIQNNVNFERRTLKRKLHCQKFTPRRIFTRDFSKYDQNVFQR